MVDVDEVATDCPVLLSIKAMEDLGVVLNFQNKTMEVFSADVYGKPLERLNSGHPILTITEYGNETFSRAGA